MSISPQGSLNFGNFSTFVINNDTINNKDQNGQFLGTSTFETIRPILFNSRERAQKERAQNRRQLRSCHLGGSSSKPSSLVYRNPITKNNVNGLFYNGEIRSVAVPDDTDPEKYVREHNQVHFGPIQAVAAEQKSLIEKIKGLALKFFEALKNICLFRSAKNSPAAHDPFSEDILMNVLYLPENR